MVYFVARVVPFVAKGGPVLLAKDGILPVAEIGILYLTIYMPDLLEKIVVFFYPHRGFQFLDDFNDRIYLSR